MRDMRKVGPVPSERPLRQSGCALRIQPSSVLSGIAKARVDKADTLLTATISEISDLCRLLLPGDSHRRYFLVQ